MKNIYITWHYTTHGVAYLKHVLSEFYKRDKLPIEKIDWQELEQEGLNLTFDAPKENAFLFDEIIYLIAPQQAFDELSSRRFSYKETILGDELVKKLGMVDVFKRIIADEKLGYNLEAELAFVKKEFPKKLNDFKQVIWRNIQHYSLQEQIKWLTEYSNFKKVYADKLKVVELNATDLRNEKQISKEVGKWVKENLSKNKVQPYINVSLGSSETQVVWHILSEGGQLPHNTRFLKTYDDKSDDPEKRFKRFSIQEIPTNIFNEISSEFIIYGKTDSPQRELVNKKMETFLKSGFSILLIGERGIGKSQIAKRAKEQLSAIKKDFKGELIEANCASFDDDSKAESELFGYKKGAFTGANHDKIGLIESAENGILFLDEIHHLSKAVQAKLMKALQTDEHNRISIRKLGETNEKKVKDVRMIFATNKTVAELKEALLPDFYDRIVQHVIKIPPLRDTKEDRLADWALVWKYLKFQGSPNPPDDNKLNDWLKKLPLYGNFRDLQKIAMYYNAFNSFDYETKRMISEKSAFEYAKNEFEKYHLSDSKIIENNSLFEFSISKKADELEADFKYYLQNWAVEKFHSRKEAALNLGVSEKTLNDWKNRKSLQKEK